MPYSDQSKNQTELFIDTTDQMWNLIKKTKTQNQAEGIIGLNSFKITSTLLRNLQNVTIMLITKSKLKKDIRDKYTEKYFR